MPTPENSTARVETFSDGVFAVAITLLVLGLHVSAPPGRLAHALGAEWPHYATYVVSFLTIGIIWMNHHAQFERIARADRTLMLLNLVLLMFVTLIPFPTELLAGDLRAPSDQHVAAAAYAGSLLAMSVAFFATYLWATHASLFSERITERHVRYLVRRNGVGLLAYVVAIALAFVNATASLTVCGLTAVYYTFPGKSLN
ncbi:MAG TPA: TMEM175 family protein [Solirubrobacteraceae bacterium]|jgi:uncharacterized membrane protein|nr:TMEM175 family protein [Solirubrobacteraceae bacterium]